LQSLVSPHDFVNLAGKHHFYTAAECPLLVRSAEAVTTYLELKSEAEEGRAHHDRVTRETREYAARMVGGAPEDIAFLSSSSEAISAVAGITPFQPGDNVVINDLEFSSVALPWLRLRRDGLEVRVVRHEDWRIPTDRLLDAVDERTRLVALSHVSYINGWRHDVPAISAALRDSGTRLLLDATQSAGIFPIDAQLADFVIASTYKWLLGTHGLAVLHVNRERFAPDDPDPRHIGWYSIQDQFTEDRYDQYTLREGAGRFETGYLNFPAIYALHASLPYLEALPPERRVAHVHALGDELIAGFGRLGLPVITPEDHASRGASVTFLHPDAEAIGAALAAQGIHAWAGDGRVRASPNIFTASEDVDVLLAALESILAQVNVESPA